MERHDFFVVVDVGKREMLILIIIRDFLEI